MTVGPEGGLLLFGRMAILLVSPGEQRAEEQDHDVVGGIKRLAGEGERETGDDRDADGDEDGFHGGGGRIGPARGGAHSVSFRQQYTPDPVGRYASFVIRGGGAPIAKYRSLHYLQRMSRAFTREDDARDVVVPRRVSPLPPGARNYLTAAGAERLRTELKQLTETAPRLITAAAEEGGRGADAKEELQRTEARIAYLQQSLGGAEVVAPPLPPHDVVRFGAIVSVRDAKGVESIYHIVGVDETDFFPDAVSWLSPIARALLNVRLGQKVVFKFPSGATQLEVVSIRY